MPKELFDEEIILGQEEEGIDTLIIDDNRDEISDEETLADTPTETPELTEIKDGETSVDTLKDESDKSWFNAFKKETGSEFDDIDSLKEALKPKEDDKVKTEYDTLKAKHEKLIEEFKKTQNPKDYFNSDTEFKKNLFLKEHSSVRGEVADKLFNIDLEKSNPLDIIAVNLMIDHKSLSSGEAAKNWFLRKQGIDPDDFDFNDLDEYQKTEINIAAEEAVKHISSLRDGVVIPDSKSVDDILADVSIEKDKPFDMTQWDGKVDDLIKSINEIKIEDEGLVYSEKISDEFRNELTDYIKDAIVQGKIEPTEENIKSLGEQARDVYWLENRPSIIKRIVDQEVKKAKEDFHKEVHNDVDPDKQPSATPKGKGKTTNLLSILGIPE